MTSGTPIGFTADGKAFEHNPAVHIHRLDDIEVQRGGDDVSRAVNGGLALAENFYATGDQETFGDAVTTRRKKDDAALREILSGKDGILKGGRVISLAISFCTDCRKRSRAVTAICVCPILCSQSWLVGPLNPIKSPSPEKVRDTKVTDF